MTRDQLALALRKYIPEPVSLYVADQLIEHQVEFTISRPRVSKLGDYRPPFRKRGHRISINGNLNPYHFLLTTLHELAHLDCWEQFKNRAAPHGAEWKMAFQEQLEPILKSNIFPDDVQTAIERYISKPKSSSCYDPVLVKTLQQFDQEDGLIYVSDLPEGSRFLLPPRRVFVKGHKVRSRYNCMNEANKKPYLISPVARVIPL